MPCIQLFVPPEKPKWKDGEYRVLRYETMVCKTWVESLAVV